VLKLRRSDLAAESWVVMDPFLSVDLIEDDIQRPRVRVRGEIDMLTVDSLRTRLADIIDAIPPGSTLTIDAAHISFLSVDGVRVFRRVAEDLHTAGSELVLDPVSLAVELMLRVTGLEWLIGARTG
jgi:anti-anti-sigma factor